MGLAAKQLVKVNLIFRYSVLFLVKYETFGCMHACVDYTRVKIILRPLLELVYCMFLCAVGMNNVPI
jgi:hypothetical protein